MKVKAFQDWDHCDGRESQDTDKLICMISLSWSNIRRCYFCIISMFYPFQAGEFEGKSTILLTNKYEGRELYPAKFCVENLSL